MPLPCGMCVDKRGLTFSCQENSRGYGGGRTLNAKSGSLQNESVIPQFFISIFLKPRLWLHVSVRARCWDPGILIILNLKGLWVTQQKRRERGRGRGGEKTWEFMVVVTSGVAEC